MNSSLPRRSFPELMEPLPPLSNEPEKENYQRLMNVTTIGCIKRSEEKHGGKDMPFRETVRLISHRPPTVNRNRRNTVYGRLPATTRPDRQASPKAKQAEEPATKELDPLYSDPSVLQQYQILSHIGKGSYAVVSSAIEKQTGRSMAVKIYEKMAIRDPQRLDNVKREIKNLKSLHHRNIVSLYHAVLDKKRLYLIMENAGKNSLHSLLRRKEQKRFSEHEAANYFKQILSAIACCHRNGICHRDIKLENILVTDSNQIKLIDFGFSVNNRNRLNTYCGTPSYMAPEIAGKTSYEGWQVDMWSCGVLLYVMLCGSYPFRGLDEKELYRKIRGGKYTFREQLQLSMGAKRVIGKLLKVLPSSRCPAEQLQFDKWFDQ